jgi:hypothetical protein
MFFSPSLSPALQSNPNRFDGLLGEYGAEDAVDRVARSVSPRGTELRGVAKAIYSFNAHNARSVRLTAFFSSVLWSFFSSELAFKKGDLIRIRRMIDHNWYEGEMLGRVGIVPVNYVEVSMILANRFLIFLYAFPFPGDGDCAARQRSACHGR